MHTLCLNYLEFMHFSICIICKWHLILVVRFCLFLFTLPFLFTCYSYWNTEGFVFLFMFHGKKDKEKNISRFLLLNKFLVLVKMDVICSVWFSPCRVDVRTDQEWELACVLTKETASHLQIKLCTHWLLNNKSPPPLATTSSSSSPLCTVISLSSTHTGSITSSLAGFIQVLERRLLTIAQKKNRPFPAQESGVKLPIKIAGQMCSDILILAIVEALKIFNLCLAWLPPKAT